MNTKTYSVSDEARQHDQAFSAAFTAARDVRNKYVKVRPHRAISGLKVGPYLLAQAIVLPIVLCLLLLWARPYVLAFWREVALFWAPGLHLPLTLAATPNRDGVLQLATAVGGNGAPMPTDLTLIVTAVLTFLLFLFSYTLNKNKTPMKYPVRIFCGVMAASLLFFWLSPQSYPYTIVDHVEEMMAIGYVVVVAAPVMLAMGYYILRQNLLIKLLNTALILGFFIVLIPHQALAHAVIVDNFSLLFMPALYICFGAVFDALVFVALYSWAASTSPMDATV